MCGGGGGGGAGNIGLYCWPPATPHPHPVSKLWKNGEGIESWGCFAALSEWLGWSCQDTTPHSHSAKSTNQLTNEHHHHRPFTPMNMNDRPTPDPPHSSSFLCCCFFCNSLWFISFSAASLIVFISVLYWVKCKTWLHCSPHPAEPTMSLPVESWAIFCVPCCCGKYRTLTFNHPMTPFDPDLSRLWLLCGRAGATYFD